MALSPALPFHNMVLLRCRCSSPRGCRAAGDALASARVITYVQRNMPAHNIMRDVYATRRRHAVVCASREFSAVELERLMRARARGARVRGALRRDAARAATVCCVRQHAEPR